MPGLGTCVLVHVIRLARVTFLPFLGGTRLANLYLGSRWRSEAGCHRRRHLASTSTRGPNQVPYALPQNGAVTLSKVPQRPSLIAVPIAVPRLYTPTKLYIWPNTGGPVVVVLPLPAARATVRAWLNAVAVRSGSRPGDHYSKIGRGLSAELLEVSSSSQQAGVLIARSDRLLKLTKRATKLYDAESGQMVRFADLTVWSRPS